MSCKRNKHLISIREYAIEPSTSTNDKQRQRDASFREMELQLSDDDALRSTVVLLIHSAGTQQKQNLALNILLDPLYRSKTIMQDLLLPIGYPNSVADGYMEYQFYDSLQGLCSYLRSILCSAQVLQAAGVGTAEATALSAAMTWALKDGAALLGGLVFSYQVAGVLDSHVKEFRFFADLINNVGLTLDMMAPYCKGHLLLVSSAAGLCKTLCGLSAGATKSSLTQHFALEGNMADVTAKESTQETFVSLLGTIMGVGLAHRLQSLQEASASDGTDLAIQQIQWSVFIALTMLHIWSNYKGVALLRLRTLNRERAEVVLDKVVDSVLGGTEPSVKARRDLADATASMANAAESLSHPDIVYESLLASAYKMLRPGRLRLDASLADIVQANPSVLKDFLDERYALALNDKRQVLVCLLVGASCQDQLKAFVHALAMLRYSESATKGDLSKEGLSAASHRAQENLDGMFPADASDKSVSLMDELAKKGWDVEHRLHVGFSRRRFSWVLKDD